MNVVYSFIGKMPEYIVLSVKQLRLFFIGPIYIIFNDMSEKIRNDLEILSVHFINYDSVKSTRFFEREKRLSFEHVPRLYERAELFKRSYERFYLLHNLMIQKNLTNVWFMELDIMMYMNPNDFLPCLEGKSLAFAYHRLDHCNSGIFYVNCEKDLKNILSTFDESIVSHNTEMKMLWIHYTRNPHITMFPLCIPTEKENKFFWKDHELFGEVLFDGAILGIVNFGKDPFHTGGKIVLQPVSNYAPHFLNIWKYGETIWEKDSSGLLLPYFQTNTGIKFRIANLHIHSKNLLAASSEREMSAS